MRWQGLPTCRPQQGKKMTTWWKKRCITNSKCGRKCSSFNFLICLKRTSLKGWPWLGWHWHQLLHKSRCLIFTFPFFILSIHAFTISKVQVIRLHFFFRILQSQYEKSVSFSALGILHSGEEKISIMAKGNITPYIFQVQQRSTASPLKEYLIPWQVCFHILRFSNIIFSSLLIIFCIMQILPLVL